MRTKKYSLLTTAAASAMLVGLAGCATNGGNLNLAQVKTTGGNSVKPTKMTAKVVGSATLADAGLANIKTVFVPARLSSSGQNMLYIDGQPFVGKTGTAVPETFLPSANGYLVVAWQPGSMCSGAPGKGSTEFYHVSPTGQIASTLRCVDLRPMIRTTPTAAYYYVTANTMIGVTPSGRTVTGPQGVSDAIPLPGNKWQVRNSGAVSGPASAILSADGSESKLFYGASNIVNVRDAVFVNTPPYRPSTQTGYALMTYTDTGGDSGSGVQILTQPPPETCYGLIGRACGSTPWYLFNWLVATRYTNPAVGTNFIWGQSHSSAYVGRFAPLSIQQLLATPHYTIHMLHSNVTYTLPFVRTIDYATNAYPTAIVTPKTALVVDRTDKGKYMGAGFILGHLPDLRVIPASQIAPLLRRYDIKPPPPMLN